MHVNVEKGYHEGMIKNNHDLTINGVALLKKLQEIRSDVDNAISSLIPLINHAKQFPHNEGDQ